MADPRASAMSEAQLMEAIRTITTQLGLHAYHAHDSRRSWGPGFPDLVIAGLGGVLFRECKTEHGGISPDQKRWGYILQASGQDYQVWRPRHLLDGTIARQLKEITGLCSFAREVLTGKQTLTQWTEHIIGEKK